MVGITRSKVFFGIVFPSGFSILHGSVFEQVLQVYSTAWKLEKDPLKRRATALEKRQL